MRNPLTVDRREIPDVSTHLSHSTDERRHLNDYLVQGCDRALADAVQAVKDGKASQVAVTLAFMVKHDPEEGTVVTHTQKGTTTVKGRWKPTPSGESSD